MTHGLSQAMRHAFSPEHLRLCPKSISGLLNPTLIIPSFDAVSLNKQGSGAKVLHRKSAGSVYPAEQRNSLLQ
jgi:hypothetical protein